MVNKFQSVVWRRWVAGFLLLWGVAGCFHPRMASFRQRIEEKQRWRRAAKEDIRTVSAWTHFCYAEQLAMAGRAEEAIAELKLAIAADPKSAYLREVLAFLLLDKGEPEAALPWVEEAIRLTPERASSHNLLGQIYLELERYPEAEQAFRKALSLDPHEPEYVINLADSLLRQNRPADALRVLQEFSKAHPDQAEPLFFVGVILEATGREDEAAAVYRQVMNIDPWFYPALYKLFALEVNLGHYAAAVELGRSWLGVAPGDDKARLMLVQVMVKAGEDEQALEVLEEGKGQGSLDPRWWLEKGFILLRLMRYEEAREEFEAALSLDSTNDLAVFGLGVVEFYSGHYVESASYLESLPKNSELYLAAQVQLSSLALVQGDTGRAVGIMERLYQAKPERMEVLVSFVAVLRDAEKYDRAFELLNSTLSRKPNQEDLLYELGLLYMAEGRNEEAVALMEKILWRNPKSARALNFIGFCWAEQGIRLEEAEAKIREALRLEPGAGYIMDSLGWVYYQRGEYAAALEWLTKSLRAAGPDSEILEHLGDCLLKMKQKAKAVERYKQALISSTSQKMRRRLMKKLGGLT